MPNQITFDCKFGPRTLRKSFTVDHSKPVRQHTHIIKPFKDLLGRDVFYIWRMGSLPRHCRLIREAEQTQKEMKVSKNETKQSTKTGKSQEFTDDKQDNRK